MLFRSIASAVGLVAVVTTALPAVFPSAASAQDIIEIIDATGDGANALDGPEYGSVAVDEFGRTYVTGSESDNAFRIDTDGTITQIIDATGDGVNGLDDPQGVAVDGLGNVFVVGHGTDNVFRIAPDGTITEIIDATGDGTNGLDDSYYIVATRSGTVYVCGYESNNVFRIDPDGAITQVMDATGDGTNPLGGANGLALAADGTLFVNGYDSDRVFRLAPDGTITQVLDSTGDGVNAIDVPESMVVDSRGNLYVVGDESHNAFRVEPDGDIVEIIDSSGDGLASFVTPYSIAVAPNGSAFVAGYDSDNVFRIAPDGTITGVVTASGDGSNALNGPADLAADECGNVLASGYSSDNVFRVSWPMAAPDFQLGAKLVGMIDAADTDAFTFYATKGTKITLIAKRTKDGAGTLVPTFTITAPDGSTLATSQPKKKTAQVKSAEAMTTGMFTVALSAGDAGTGGYSVKTKGRFPSKANEILEVGRFGAVSRFPGVPGMRITSLKVKALPPKGEYATVDGTPSALTPRVEALFGPCGIDTPLGALTTNKSGKTVSGKDIALVRAGLQRLRFDGNGTVGFARVTAKLKFQKGKGEVSE